MSNTPGGQLALNKNPAPTLGAVEQYYLHHFFKLCTEMNEAAIPITRIYLYQQQIDEQDSNFADIILEMFAYFMGQSREFQEKQSNLKNKNKSK